MSYQSLFKLFLTNDIDSFNKIYQNRLNSEASIKLDLKINNNEAFIFFHNDINELLYKLGEYDIKINNLLNKLPKLAYQQYVKKCLIDEIEFNNSIEGVISTRKDIFNIIDEIPTFVKDKNRLESIVNKYKMLLSNNTILLNDSKDVRKLYDELLINEISENDKNNIPDGIIFRKDPVYIYNNYGSKIIHTGIFPESKIIEMMDKSLLFLNNENINPFIRISVFHYLFGYIHPFYDGNGRINRFITSYYLSNYTSIIKYRLSMTIKENLNDYLTAFNNCNDVRNKGDISTFVYPFLNILYKSYEKTELYLLEKIENYNFYKEKIYVLDLDKDEEQMLLLLIETELFSSLGLNNQNLMVSLNKSLASINLTLKKLKEKNLIKSTRFGRISYYSPILNNLK